MQLRFPIEKNLLVLFRFTKFLSRKFIEMGCLPGEKIKLCNIAPFGDPIAIEVSGYVLSLRNDCGFLLTTCVSKLESCT